MSNYERVINQGLMEIRAGANRSDVIARIVAENNYAWGAVGSRIIFMLERNLNF